MKPSKKKLDLVAQSATHNLEVDFVLKNWEFFLSVYNRRSARDRKQAKLAAATKTPPSSDGDGMTEGNNNNVDSSTTPPPPPADQVLAKTNAASNGLIRFEEDEGGNAEADDTQESSQVRGLLILI